MGRSAAEGAHVVSTEEKTGMQALERLHETKPVRPGLVERVEFEYIRHGTLCSSSKLLSCSITSSACSRKWQQAPRSVGQTERLRPRYRYRYR
jgi:hypothetical protein